MTEKEKRQTVKKRRNLFMPEWVDNAMVNLAERMNISYVEYFNEVIKAHALKNECDETGKLPGMDGYKGSFKDKL